VSYGLEVPNGLTQPGGGTPGHIQASLSKGIEEARDMRDRSESGGINRRNYWKGAVIAIGEFALGGPSEPAAAGSQSDPSGTGRRGGPVVENRTLKEQGFDTYSRYKSGFGGPINSPEYPGKLVPELRGPGSPPVPVTTVDGSDLPWKIVGGGHTIQAFQGDRVRINVHNRLPEVTTVHWHGLELPNGYNGIPGVSQPPIKPGETLRKEWSMGVQGGASVPCNVDPSGTPRR
jgi:FtsP/CotA-like multicopper oxidase with cupredoxin domain